MAGASFSLLGPWPAACDKHVLSVQFFAGKTEESCVTDCQLVYNAGVGVEFAVNLRRHTIHISS